MTHVNIDNQVSVDLEERQGQAVESEAELMKMQDMLAHRHELEVC